MHLQLNLCGHLNVAAVQSTAVLLTIVLCFCLETGRHKHSVIFSIPSSLPLRLAWNNCFFNEN